MEKKKSFGRALAFAVRNTYLIAVSWIPVAIAFGLIVQNAGGNFLWAGLSGIICPFGSLQMLSFSFAAANAAWLTMLVTSFALTCRHVFYGLPYIEKFRSFGKAGSYMIYMLCDELFSAYINIDVPEDIDEKQAYLAVALVLQGYWVVLTMAAAFLGSLIPFDLTGVDFALTALFTVIMVNMITESETKLPFACALVCGVLGLFLLGKDSFLAPALLMVTVVLLLMRPVIEKTGKGASKDGV